MTLPWVTSAALVILLVASIVFPWQKEVEHVLQLRREKFDLYRRFLAQVARAIRFIGDTEIFNTDAFIELECLSEEISILAFDDAVHASTEFVANLGLIHDSSTIRFSAKNLGDLRLYLNRATIALREDIRQTRPWPLGNRYGTLSLKID